jgi:hypothetical protein
MCFGKISSSWSTCGTRPDTLIKHPSISHERVKKDVIVITTNITNP